MFGKALISCDIGSGTSFIDQYDVTGLMVKRSDSDALLAAVQTLTANSALARVYGDNARKRYLELFTAKTQAEHYADLYARLLDASCKNGRQKAK